MIHQIEVWLQGSLVILRELCLGLFIKNVKRLL